MENQIHTPFARIFKSPIWEIGEMLAYICSQKQTHAARDDFYEIMGIEALATIPANTTQVDGIGNCCIISGQGAVISFARLRFGPKGTIESFYSTGRAVSNDFTKNYCPPVDEDILTCDYLADIIREVEEKTGAVSYCCKQTRLRILLMPACGGPNYRGNVYIHKTNNNHVSAYTLVLPHATNNDSNHAALTEMLAAELSVCVGDTLLRENPDLWPEINKTICQNKQPGTEIPSVVIKEKSDKNAFLDQLTQVYKPIAGHLLSHKTESILSFVGLAQPNTQPTIYPTPELSE